MKTVFTLFVFIGCLAMSNATFKLFKSKLKATPAIYPIARFRTVKYIAPSVVVPDPLPATYARSIPYQHVSTYSLSSPSVVTFAPSTQTYAVPYAYTSTVAVPVAAHRQPLAIAYDSAPIVHYSEPETAYAEPTWSYGAPIVEDHFSIYDEHYSKH